MMEDLPISQLFLMIGFIRDNEFDSISTRLFSACPNGFVLLEGFLGKFPITLLILELGIDHVLCKYFATSLALFH